MSPFYFKVSLKDEDSSKIVRNEKTIGRQRKIGIQKNRKIERQSSSYQLDRCIVTTYQLDRYIERQLLVRQKVTSQLDRYKYSYLLDRWIIDGQIDSYQQLDRQKVRQIERQIDNTFDMILPTSESLEGKPRLIRELRIFLFFGWSLLGPTQASST